MKEPMPQGKFIIKPWDVKLTWKVEAAIWLLPSVNTRCNVQFFLKVTKRTVLIPSSIWIINWAAISRIFPLFCNIYKNTVTGFSYRLKAPMFFFFNRLTKSRCCYKMSRIRSSCDRIWTILSFPAFHCLKVPSALLCISNTSHFTSG